MQVFELTKSRYPNWWYLIRLSYFYDDSKYKVHDMCTAVCRGIIGFVYACILPWIVSILVMAFFEPLFWLIHGFVDPVFFELTFLLGIYLWGIIAIACLFGGLFILDEDPGNLGGRLTNVIKSDKFNFLRRSTAIQPSAFAVWYAGIKDKYCPMVRLVDDTLDDDEDDVNVTTDTSR